MASNGSIVYRQAGPSDLQGLGSIDDSFVTDTIYEVVAGPGGFSLRRVAVEPPLVKVFPKSEAEGERAQAGRHVEVAVEGGAVCGFVEAGVAEWHSRLIIYQLTVAPTHRRRGVGGALMGLALAHGRRLGARTAWLETTNVNVPAVSAYLKMGFSICGLDMTFYRGTPAEGEIALFMGKALDVESP